MARQTGQYPFTGRIGNVIGYERNGVHFVRSMPAKVRQTAATRKAAHKFGIASSNGSLIRKAFAAHLDVKGDSARVNRLNQTLIRSGLQGLNGYQFNRHTGVEKFFSVAPERSENNQLRIPAQVLPQLPKATSLVVKLIAVKIDFNSRRITGTVTDSAIIDLKQPFEGLVFDTTLKGKGTLVVALQIMVYQGRMFTLDRRYKAADLIAVVPPVAQHTIQKNQKKSVRPRPSYEAIPLTAKADSSVKLFANAVKLE